MKGVVCAEQLRAQFVAVVCINIKTGCPKALGPVVHGPSTKQTARRTGEKQKLTTNANDLSHLGVHEHHTPND